jgi:uncharacterized protein (DUF2147 family)
MLWEIRDLRSTISSIQADVASIQADVTTLELTMSADVASLEEEISTLSSTVSADVTSLEEEISTLSSTVSAKVGISLGAAVFDVVTDLQLFFATKRASLDTAAASSEVMVGYNHTVSPNGAYIGGVYSPINDRIYFVPFASADAWHFVDCETGNVEEYDHGLSQAPVNNAYVGGVYSPKNNRIYFAPVEQAPETVWHYVDCGSGNVVGYIHALTTVPELSAYWGGVYSPKNDRIYFAPLDQAPQPVWHYVDCESGNVVEYIHALTSQASGDAYRGGVYSPANNRIYFVPRAQVSQEIWHYIDCETGNVVEYLHGFGSSLTGGYSGGAYSPMNNRIYFAPNSIASEASWHYLDCESGNVVEYTHTFQLPNHAAYAGAVYSPANNRIYFVPYQQAGESDFHYIDCESGDVVEYFPDSASGMGQYRGGVYSPKNNRIYFVPYAAVSKATWHYLTDLSDASYPAGLFGSGLFNAF